MDKEIDVEKIIEEKTNQVMSANIFENLIDEVEYYYFGSKEKNYNIDDIMSLLAKCKLNTKGKKFIKSILDISKIINPLFIDDIQKQIDEFLIYKDGFITTSLGNLFVFKILYSLKVDLGLNNNIIREIFIKIFFSTFLNNKFSEKNPELSFYRSSISSSYTSLILVKNKAKLDQYNIRKKDINIEFNFSLPRSTDILEITYDKNINEIKINEVNSLFLNNFADFRILMYPNVIHITYFNHFFSYKNLFLTNKLYFKLITKLLKTSLISSSNLTININNTNINNTNINNINIHDIEINNIKDRIGSKLSNYKIVKIKKDLRKNIIEYKITTTDDYYKVKKIVEENGYGNLKTNIHGGKKAEIIEFTIKEKLEI